MTQTEYRTLLDGKSAEELEALRLASLESETLSRYGDGFTSLDLAKMDFAPLRWAIPEVFPEGFTVLAGKPKVGKSWMTLGIALALSVGGRALGSIPVEKRGILYLALEDSPRRLKSRIDILQGLPSTELRIFTRWPQGTEGMDSLRGILAEIPAIRMVFIDTLALFQGEIDSSNGDRYRAEYAAVHPLQELSHERGVSIIVNHHLRKMEATDFIDTVSGTTGLTGAADTVAVLKRSRGKTGAELLITGRDLEKDAALALELSMPVGWSLMGQAEDMRRSQEQIDLLRVLKEVTEPLTTGELAEALGKSKAATSYLLRKMVTDGVVKAAGYGKYVYTT